MSISAPLDFTGARSVEDLLNLGWKKFLHPEDFPKTANSFFQAIQTGKSAENLQRVRRVDGEYRWHHVRAEPLRDREGRIIEWYGLSVDIDEGKKIEERLRRSEAYLAEAQRLTHTATAAYDATKILYFSDEAFRLFGFDPLQGLPSREAVWQRIHPDDVDTMNEKIERALRERRSFQNEFRTQTARWDGQARRCRHLARILCNRKARRDYRHSGRRDRTQARRRYVAPWRSVARTSTEAKPHRYLGFGRDDEAFPVLVGRELPDLGV